MRAILNYKVYENSFTSTFEISGKETKTYSDCRNFSLSLGHKKTGKNETFKPHLEWIGEQRPKAGTELLTLEIELPPHQLNEPKIFQHGYQSWSLCGVYPLSEVDESPKLDFLKYCQENFYTNHSGVNGDWHSEGMILLISSSKEPNYFVGAIGPGEQGVKFRVISSSRKEELESSKKKPRIFNSGISLIYDFYRYEDFRGNKIPLTPIGISRFTIKPELHLKKYFSELGKAHKVKLTTTPAPTGWCSWYQYYTKISEKIILKNLSLIKEKKLPIQFFQIDDGYQKEIGDWLTTNDKFPGGMRLLAEEIRREKLIPGIWLAPFLVRKKSEFFQKYPEAVLKDRDGKPTPALWNPLWGMDHTYCIDVTHPTSRDFLENIFKTIVKEFGYSYLKLDFLYAALLPGWTYDRGVSPHKRYTDVIKFIRKIVGKEIFLLGCGAPIYPSIGLFDAMRISCDVAPFWGREKVRILSKDKHALCTERALINDINRSSMHRNLWINDPDCLLVRESKNKMTTAQTQLMASVMAVSGGILFISDDLSLIGEERLTFLKRTLELGAKCKNKTPIPIGISSGLFPPALYNPAGFLGIWNPNEVENTIEIETTFVSKPKQFIDYWTGQVPESLEYSVKTGILKLKLPAFGSVVLQTAKVV
ncbi:glycoside hydrolase family 36 protein [Leptospira kirschneri]|uniref:Alpha-galactosidase n=2 Tax=Leptospira kirschneri TaxID=29507 RepID=A0A1T1DN57_9LEPT|nr:glycoside hydrolase family 36 protein [Leptospira kirschneri]EJO69186.1 glycosyl hydrolase, family 31 domain protein [Leptospira kirschneri serovar Grippotyphosa str. RM52]EKO51349.1 glycosyl hydrolase, family 31 domain protein [Leptospira kirschneri str. 200802841]EKP06602.1 glycosyl hydrolase, family 31 domain protein [Leptospira kirschneri str. 2008720114]EKQ82466.1 glycosyl hydrolase, family 31 domain protein [Leptospira kirschneri serovar Grippotyphosa str. Moskva]EKR07499.1 glycosyl h